MEPKDILRFALAILAAVVVSVLIFIHTARKKRTTSGTREMECARAEGQTATAKLVKSTWIPRDSDNRRAYSWRREKWISTYAYTVNGQYYERTIMQYEQPEQETVLCYMPGKPEKLVNPAKLGGDFVLLALIPAAVLITAYILLGKVI